MRIHSQNLNDSKTNPGSMFWYGRAWLKKSASYDEIMHLEWSFGRRATSLALTASFGRGDSDAGMVLHLSVPFIVSLFLCFPYVYRCKESQVGVSFHMGAVHLYTFTDMMESRRDYPWWKKSHSWYWPWEMRHHLTEILEHKANLPDLAATVWSDQNRKFLESYDERKKAEASVTQVYNYTYVRKNGEIQQRRAAVHVDRMTWRARWWPIIPLQTVRTSIDVSFNEEIGEQVGSWKGGCVGCSYYMQPGETPLATLRRMELERTF